MSHRPNLPLNALRAFEATLRLGGIGRAADALGVTHGAVSRQIAILQQRLGVTLFEGPRSGRKPTEEALRLWAEIAPAFDTLAAALASRVGAGERLRVSCLSTLTARWLIPRLPGFADAAPDIHIELTESYAPLDSAVDGADVAIRMLGASEPPPRGLEATPFMANRIGLAARPGVDPTRMRRLVSRSHPTAWADWAARTELAPDLAPPLMFDHQQTMIEAAIAGLGTCITQRSLIEADLAAGRLVAPLGFLDDGAVFAVFRRPGRPGRSVRRFNDWLATEGRKSDSEGRSTGGARDGHPLG